MWSWTFGLKSWKKSWNFKMGFSRSGKVLEKYVISQSFGKVMDMCYIHMII